MKQILHIFAKDTRHQWLEILISLVLMTALVLTSRRQFSPGTNYAYGFTVSFSSRGSLGLLSYLLTLLIPLGWWILISPAVHEERLVGDRQFWLTRPYEWKNLLAAKALFILIYLYLPLFIAQCGVLAKMGFNPFNYLPGVFYDLFLITALVILPLVALATVTRDFARMTLAILGVVLCLILISWLASEFPGARIPTPFGDSLSQFLVICGCLLVVGLQYAARKTRSSWIILAVTLGMMAVLACAAPDQALMDRRYPAEQAPGVDFSYRNDPGTEPVASVAQGPHDVVINVPIHVSGIGAGSMIIPEALRVTLEAPDGSHWTSFWQPIYWDKFLPGERTARGGFAMPRSIYEKLKPMPLHVHISLALIRARQGETTTVSMSLNDFQIPGFGACTPLTGFFDKPDEIGGIVCRAALRRPPLTYVHVVWSYDDCHVSSEERRNVQGDAWAGSLDRPVAEFAIAPVWSEPFDLTNREPEYHVNEPRHICPGTPVSFTIHQPAGRLQTAVDIPNFVLPELSRGQVRVMTTP